MTKIIYSLSLMSKLVDMGYEPITCMPNPNHPRLTCWVFKENEDFNRDLNKLLETNYAKDR